MTPEQDPTSLPDDAALQRSEVGSSTLPPAEVNSPDPAQLARLRALARLMDSSIRVPGTDFRFGMDALVGLVPGLGDVLGALVSGYIVFESARLGASAGTLIRMLGNIGIEAVAGTIPALGDFFDAAFRANNRNVQLLEDHIDRPEAVAQRSRLMLTSVGVGVLLVVGGLAAFSIWVLVSLARMITS